MVASIGLQLDPLDDLYRWRQIAKDAGVTAWYFAAESVAAERRVTGLNPIPPKVARVGARLDEFGLPSSPVPFYSKPVADWAHVPLGLKDLDPATNLFAQARLYTFLAYRRGFQTSLTNHSYTAEQSVHAYVRIVLAWVEQWPGLTLATKSERERESAELRRLEKRERLTKEQQYQATIALPSVVEYDLCDLLAAFEMAEAANARRTSSGGVTTNDTPVVIAQQLVGRVRLAILAMLRDPSLRILSAYNLVRGEANRKLGGALARARLNAGDYVLPAVDAKFRENLLSGRSWGELTVAERAARVSERPIWGVLLGQSDLKQDSKA